MSDTSADSAESAESACMIIACFFARAMKSAEYTRHLQDVFFAEWKKERLDKKRQILERHECHEALVMTLSRFLETTRAVRKYDASKPKRIIGSFLLRCTAQNMYLKMRAVATLRKYLKCKDAEREIYEYWSKLRTMEKLNQEIRVMPDNLKSMYSQLDMRFNCRK
jgi:hypothetical protein